jgi:hypothetical protein
MNLVAVSIMQFHLSVVIGSQLANLRDVACGQILLQKSFASPNTIFPARRRSDRIIMRATSIGDKPTSDFVGALEGTSIGSCRLFRLFAENWSDGLFRSFATLSALFAPDVPAARCLFVGVERTSRLCVPSPRAIDFRKKLQVDSLIGGYGPPL